MPDAIKSSDLGAPNISSARGAVQRDTSGASEDDFRGAIARLRDAACARARPAVKAGAAPIRVMARMVNDLIA
ncbi:MAG: hypothetical protein ACRDID_18120, partial [Ktedonobacterales bacterium]